MKPAPASTSFANAGEQNSAVAGQDNSVFVPSFAQQRLWLLDQILPDSPVYNIATEVRLRGPLDTAALQNTLNAIVHRHEPLRTTFAMEGAQLVQVIAPSRSVELPVVDLGGLSAAQREPEAKRLAKEEARRLFDLAQDAMLRARLLRLGADDHLLILTMHHIASDGWSVGLLLKELGLFYAASLKPGSGSGLPELAIQYADFAVWQRQWLEGEALAKQLGYWKQQLAGTPDLLELPMDHPRPAVQSYRGGLIPVRVGKQLTESLRTLSQREGCTLFMTMLAAFQTLVSRYTNREDIVVGSPIANRSRAEIEGLIGCFVNTLVLRTDLSGDPTFRELLGRVREVALGAYAHQDLPFEKLVEELQPPRDQSYTPLFQLMFVFQNTPMPTLALPRLTARSSDLDTGTAKFDLSLSLWETSEGMSGWVEYATDLFESATINRLLGHWETLLQGIAENPARRLSELPLLTGAERCQLVEEWNDTAKVYPPLKCLHHGIEAQVERTPEAVALVFEGRQLSYRGLNQRANQLARVLQKQGVGPEKLVGICMERSLEMVVALVATLKVGGAYVPLDPDYPTDRLAFMLEDAQVPVLLTQRRLASQLPPNRAKVICVDAEWDAIAKESSENLTVQVEADNLAYVIYTSGSTGKPKGAMNHHRGICNRLLWMQDAYQLTPKDRVLQKTPFSFDVSVWEFFWPLLTGARLVLAKPGGHKDGEYLAQLIAEQQITTLHFVPSMLQVFLDTPGLERAGCLRRVICSGEALPFELQERFFARMRAELHNLYGPTEAAVDVSYWACQRNGPLRIVPIGRPIANIQLYVLDCQLRPVPVGVPGELHIAGVGLGRGYWNRPELTAEKFIPNPFIGRADLPVGQDAQQRVPTSRLYKTGDLTRLLSDGNIEYLGRLDNQVKIRGFRIELGEIEAVLGQHPGIKESVVVAREIQNGDKGLVAYVVGAQDAPPASSDLRAFLKEKLPEYMVPAFFVPLKALPLSPNGKVDRRALPAPDLGSVESGKNFVPPTDSLEVQLVGIWEKVLGVHPVGIKDNFYDLGGHSLLAVRLFAQIEKVLGKKLPLATIFEAPTIAQLAAILRNQGWSPPWSSLVAIQPGGSKPPFFCVPPDDGTVLCFGDLARLLGKDQPLYGLEPVEMWGQKLIKHYAGQIRAFQPEGPYYLAGRCGGALIALHIAEELIAQGQQVAFLGMFGVGFPPGYQHPPFYTLRRVLYLLRHNPSYVLTPRLAIYNLQTKLFVFKRKIRKRIALIFTGVKNRQVQGVLTKRVEAIPYPVNRVYPGRITLFETNDEAVPAWSKLAAGGVECHTIKTGHVTMLIEPYVRVVAGQVRACLDSVQAKNTKLA